MADETLFGRGRGDREEPPDVDQVFSRAVERQLEEQRELNRLVQETTERLSALEDGLRSFRDQTATNLTGLRAEMHDQTARLGEEVGQQVQRVAAEVDRLRSTSTDHQVRLVQLGEAAESAISALEARQARLSDQLADVDDRLRADERPADALVAALDRFEVSLASRLDERFGAISHRLGRLQEVLTAEDDTEIDLGEELAGIRARIDEVSDDAERARREAAEQEAARRRTDQQALAERLRDELRHEIVTALRPVLDEQVPSIGAVEEAVGRILARHREQAVDEDRAALREDLREELRGELGARLAPLEEVRERLSGIDALHRRLDVLDQLRQRMDALGTGSEELVAELRDDLREELRERLAPLEDVRGRMSGLEALHGRLDALDEQVPSIGAVEEVVGRILARHREQAVDEDRAALREDLREELRGELGARLAPLEEVRERLSGIDALHRRLDLLGQLRQRMDALAAGSEELAAELRDDLGQRVDALGVASEELVTELRDELREELRAQLVPLEDVRERMSGLEALHGRLDALDEVPERLTALGAIRDALTPLDGRLTDVSRGLETLEGRLGVLEGHVGAQTQAVGSIAEEHGEALRGIAEDVSAVGPELVSQVRRALGRIADDVADLQEQLRLLRAGSTGDEEALAAFRDELSAVIGARLTEVREAAGEHRDAVDEGLRITRDAVNEGLRVTRDAVAEHREAVDEGLRATRDAVDEGVRITRDSVDESLRITRDAVDEGVRITRDSVDESLRITRDAVAEHREAVDEGLSATREAVAEHRDTVDEGLRVTRDAVAEHGRSVAADLRADRDELEARVGALLEAVEVRLDDVDEALGTSLPETLARQREELAATLSDPLSEATERLAAAREELRAVADELGGLPGELDDHVARGVDRAVTVARDESLAATRRVGETADRLDELQEGLVGLETSLVAYLEARDARMEEERMQVLRDLVEEFAEGLSRRDRSRLARRLDDVRQKVGSLTGSGDGPGDGGSGAHRSGETPADGAREVGDPDAEPPGLLAALLGDPDPASAPEDAVEPAAPWEAEDGPDPDDTETAGGDDGDGTAPAADSEEPGTTEVEGHRCPECGFVAGNAGGLASHRRTHA